MKLNSMNSYIADELSHKVACLSIALLEAQKTISLLKTEKDNLEYKIQQWSIITKQN